MTKWSESDAFGELRSWVSGAPCEGAFERIRAIVDEAHEQAPGVYEERWAPWLASSLERWEARHRCVTIEGVEGVDEVLARPWAGLLRGLKLKAFSLNDASHSDWIAGELREVFPALEHLGFVDMSVKKSELVRACEEGVFDGITSLGFRSVPLRLVTFELLMEHLEARAEVERLHFSFCDLGAKQFDRLVRSPLLPRLRALGVRGHSRIKGAGAKALAARAAECVVLESLDMAWCGVSGEGAVALARAEWPALERMDLWRNGIRAMGVSELVKQGRLSALQRAPGELDLSSQTIGQRGLKALARWEGLSDVRHLDLTDCNLKDVSPLVESGALGELESLRISLEEVGMGKDGMFELFDAATRLERVTMICGESNEEFVEWLFAHEAASRLTYVELRMEDVAMEPRAGLAVLDWDGWARGGRVVMDVWVKAGDEARARLEAHEHIEATGYTRWYGELFRIGGGVE